MNQHNCFIGLIHDYDNTRLVTLDELKEHIEHRAELQEFLLEHHLHSIKTFSLKDYCDGRKTTDLTRFKFCPLCGRKIIYKMKVME